MLNRNRKVDQNWNNKSCRLQIIHKPVKSEVVMLLRARDAALTPRREAACARYFYHCRFIIIVISAARLRRARAPRLGWYPGAHRMPVGLHHVTQAIDQINEACRQGRLRWRHHIRCVGGRSGYPDVRSLIARERLLIRRCRGSAVSL